jgi:lysophospholipid acyltransferase (LPLAT)-like uncharacterized protein
MTEAPRPRGDAALRLSLKDRLLAGLVSRLGWLFLQFVGRTSRISLHCHPAVQKLFDQKKPFIYAFWHRYQLLMLYTERGRDIYVLVSQSRDGQFIAETLHCFGYRTVRGSSSRGGMRALLEMIDHLRSGRLGGFTPDGPRGPYRSLQPGLIAAAKKSGAPIVPCGWAATKCKELSSWDRFLIPYPFGRYSLVMREPLYIAEDDPDAEDKVRRALDAAPEEAERFLHSEAG